MHYSLKLFTADEVTHAEREAATQRFCAVLEASLGDARLVYPVYQAYRRLLQAHEQSPRPWPVSPAEQLLVTQWEEAQLQAIQATFGENRYLGDADFEIGPLPAK